MRHSSSDMEEPVFLSVLLKQRLDCAVRIWYSPRALGASPGDGKRTVDHAVVAELVDAQR
jgi:hypothetical protein